MVSVAFASVAALALGLTAWRSEWGRGGGDAVGAAATVASTTVSSPLQRVLPDGSVVELRADAEIDVGFGVEPTGLRRVVLKRGEAHFTVAKNPARPFVVVAGGVEVRAVGTAFAVQHGDRAVEVVVTEGRVAVEQSQRDAQIGPAQPSQQATTVFLAVAAAQPDGPAAPPATPAPEPLAFVDAGSRARVAIDRTNAEAHVSIVSAAEMIERLAWRVPRLEFNATPLAEVVAMFNRHAQSSAPGVLAKLRLSDPALRTLPLSGTLRADNLAVLLQILESSYGIKAAQNADGEIVLSKTP